MCLLNNCCCCLSLKAGAISAAIYTIIVCIIDLITTSVAVWASLKDKGLTSATVLMFISYVFIILWLIFAIFIFVAIAKRSRKWLLPWVVAACVMTALNILQAVLTCVNHEKNLSSAGQYINFAIWIAIIIFNIYLIIVVVSYYRRNMGEVVSTQKV